ncbi:elongation factor Ts [Candidatus Falkowbacteria bacterium]|jgi:elongation factor Ts|nr:MAG: elongation factor Ts [Candidatus Falkowbacteria bacterium]
MEQIKLLRERTGAGIVDCKNALQEANGDLDTAIDILRKKGIAKAAKRGDREATEGLVKVGLNTAGTEGYIFEINAETDFVVRNDQFKEMADKIMAVIKEKSPATLEEVLALSVDGTSIAETLEHMSGVIGEKIGLSRYTKLTSTGTLGSYVHAQGNIGVLVALNASGQTELAQNIAMHIAAASPRYIKPEEVDPAELEREKSIYREQLATEGKPDEMIEKIMMGKLGKYYEEVCLLKQEYIKDDSKKVEDILNGVGIESFIRYSM